MGSTDAFPLPVARIGIIGGGQLGRMLTMAASRIGCVALVLDPDRHSPAGQLAERQIVGDYRDPGKLRQLVEGSSVATFDIENIDVDTLAALAAEGHRIHPAPALLGRLQDKLVQKQFLHRHAIATAPFADMPRAEPAAFEAFGYPLVQKLRRGGYDGRGVAVLHGPRDFPTALDGPSLVEQYVVAAKELAVMVARGRGGEMAAYPVVEMEMRDGDNMLDTLVAPAAIAAPIAAAAQQLACDTVVALDGVGIFGVEMFMTESGGLLVNEVAPRPHNSGHYTIEACVCDQFEQHLRAILGLPLGSTGQLVPAVMLNLPGAAGHNGPPVVEGLRRALAIPGVSLHLYGKSATRPQRKMGHITIVDENPATARSRAEAVREMIAITATTGGFT